MTRLVRAELLKIPTTKVAWGMFGLAAAFVLLQLGVFVALSGVGSGDDGLPPMTDPDMVRATYGSGTAGILFVMLLGIMGISGEYRHQTITQAFLTTPRRERVIAAKLVSYALVGLVAGLVLVLLTVVIALPAIEIKDGPASPLRNDVPTVLVGTVVACALYAVVGLGLGSLLRNQVAAIVVAVGWVQLVEGIVVLALPEVGKWLPGGAVQSLVQADIGFGTPDATELLPAWAAVLLLLAYALAFATLAAATTLRRDIT
jgi:ABC-2 type transport system permease protein